jgi:hypothetical protein
MAVGRRRQYIYIYIYIYVYMYIDIGSKFSTDNLQHLVQQVDSQMLFME